MIQILDLGLEAAKNILISKRQSQVHLLFGFPKVTESLTLDRHRLIRINTIFNAMDSDRTAQIQS